MMEHRGSYFSILHPRLPILVLFLFTGCTQHTETLAPDAVLPPHAKIAKAEDLPKRTPHASTYVAMGNLRLQAVLDGSVQGPERDVSLDEARKSYNQALKVDPRCLDAYRGLAQADQTTGNYEGALANFRKALAIEDKQAPLWYEMGICQARHGDWPAAQESLAKTSEIDPDNRLYTKTLAFCLAKNRHYDDSIVCFKRIMDEGQAHYNLARLLHHEKQEDLGRLHLQLALRANPNLASAQNLLAQIDHPESTATNLAAATAPSVGIDIEDTADEILQSPGNAN